MNIYPIKKFISNIWKWSWCITLPITIFFFAWAYSTYQSYYNFGVLYNSAPFDQTLHSAGKIDFVHKLQVIKSQLTKGTQSIDSNIKIVDLFLSDANKNQLGSNLPYSGREYVDAMLAYPNGKIHNVSIKYRGDTLSHWGYYKKSIRIKTKKGNLYNGLRLFNIINPKTKTLISSHLSNYMANLMGLIAVDSDIVALRINGEYRGVYLFVEQLSESTLRSNNKMPGDIYAGELIGKDLYKGIQTNLFTHPGIWYKATTNNHYPENHKAPMSSFINKLGALPNEEKGEFWDSLNHKQWARLAAFEILTQSYHYDNTHNWRLYYDPALSKFEPVIWDPMGWHSDWMPKYTEGKKAMLDVFNSTPGLRLLNDYRFRVERQLAIEDFFKNKLDKRLLTELTKTVTKVKPALEQDINIVSGSTNIKPDTAVKHLMALEEQATKIFHDVKTGYLGSEGLIRYKIINKNSLRISITGRNMVRELKFIFDKPVKSLPGKVYISYVNNKETIQVDISNSAKLEGKTLLLDVPLLSTLTLPDIASYKTRIGTSAATYEVIFNDFQDVNTIVSLEAQRGGNVVHTGKPSKWLSMIDFKGAFSVVTPNPVKYPTVWTKDRIINKTTTITEDLIIEAGVNIYIAEEASLILKGKLTAIGTELKPIRFIPKSSNGRPWGTVALTGEGSKGSRLSYCQFSGGSGLKKPLFEYSAMFSVHNVQGVTIDNCTFKDNKIVDDMVHAVYSNITFKNSLFENSKFDAIDLDISTAVIDSCTFTGSGNDSIDLMTSKAVVKNSTISQSGDKGISVGENTKLLVLNTTFLNNQIALQSKDSSTAVLYNVNITGNKQALHTYKKNWMYGTGGSIYMYKGNLKDNKVSLESGKNSYIWTYDSFIDKIPKSNKRIFIDQTVDSTNEDNASVSTLWKTDDYNLHNPEFFDSHWSIAEPTKRGVFKN